MLILKVSQSQNARPPMFQILTTIILPKLNKKKAMNYANTFIPSNVGLFMEEENKTEESTSEETSDSQTEEEPKEEKKEEPSSEQQN
ncbi:MAG: hypothetical protein QT10_C0007G0058 [archaeon GW2011_AR19]|nr:MAG: hypothetical protein QT10_C0007G0058 [archaeon GW2011_AR19]